MQLQSILDSNGMFPRSATAAPALSPFDAAVTRALSGTTNAEWGAVPRVPRSLSADNDGFQPTERGGGGCRNGSMAAGARIC